MSLVLTIPLSGVLDATLKAAGTNGQASLQEVQHGKTIVVKGKVVDKGGEAVIGANILVKGTSTGAVTDLDGNYTLSVSPNATLVFSYIGMKSQTVAVNNRKQIDVTLEDEAKAIDAVVVTALGIKRSQKALSYNVQEVKSDALTAVKDANFMNSLSGKVAGVNIQRSASGVGGGTRVVMRGNKSISGDNNVLYVIDGVPIGNQADHSRDGSSFGGGTSSEGIGNFNPDDIESISVLTGPSAAALYGASAANGVILINTKKGAAGSVKVNVSSSVEASNVMLLPKFQNRYGNVTGDYMSWGDKLETPSTLNVRDFFNTGVTFNNSFNFSVGTEKSQTYVSASAINSKGIIPNNLYNRYNAMIRNTSKFLNDKLTLDVSASYVREFANNMISYGTYFNPIVGLYLYPRGENFEQERFFERYDDNKGYPVQQWTPGSMGSLDAQNPYWVAYRNIRPEVKDRFMLTGQLSYKILEWLTASARVRLDNTYTEREDKRYASTVETHAKPLGRYNYSNEKFGQRYGDFLITANKGLGEQFRLNATLGTSYEEYDTKGHGYGGQLLVIPNKFTYGNVSPASAAPSESGGNSRKSNFAAFASAELSYKSALFLTLTGRTDKPSQLVNSVNPWIFYPSIGLSGVITDLLSPETKAKIRPVISYAKVRTSYTEVGSPIPFTGLTPGTVTRSMVGGKVSNYDYYPLSDLKAERTRSVEFGLDTRWFNALTLGVTIYQSNTYNQLLAAKLDAGTGYNKMYVQAGNVRNRGIELSLGLDKEFGAFSYSTKFTATANRNRVMELPSNVKNPVDGKIIDLSDIQVGRFRIRVGGEIGDVYANERLKRNDEGYYNYDNPGDAIQKETTEPYKLGSVNSKWNFGWKHDLSYKGFDLSFLFTARLGGIVISKTQAILNQYGVSEESALARDNGGVLLGNYRVDPKAYYSAVEPLDAYNVYSATNVRLQELRLSYNLPKKWLGKVLSNASLSMYATNLWMIYNKAPFDPELTASTGTFGQGYDNFMLPSQRTMGVSVKIGF